MTLILALLLSGTAFAKKNDGSTFTGKKSDFIDFMLPKIDAINKEILSQRERLLILEKKFQAKQSLASAERKWLEQLATNYNVSSPDFSSKATWESLKLKVDIIPASMAIAQAATESGWGNSRFAKKGNNYFGQSCFKRGCGIKPNKKSSFYYEVKTFSSALESVRSYIYNLNSHSAYTELRKLRNLERQKNQSPHGIILVKGLVEYSESGQTYVNYIKGMINKQKLHQLDREIA